MAQVFTLQQSCAPRTWILCCRLRNGHERATRRFAVEVPACRATSGTLHGATFVDRGPMRCSCHPRPSPENRGSVAQIHASQTASTHRASGRRPANKLTARSNVRPPAMRFDTHSDSQSQTVPGLSKSAIDGAQAAPTLQSTHPNLTQTCRRRDCEGVTRMDAIPSFLPAASRPPAHN